MLFMIIERVKDCGPRPIYRHLRDKGRGLPEGLKYIDSWIEPNFDRCFQLMECDDARLLQEPFDAVTAVAGEVVVDGLGDLRRTRLVHPGRHVVVGDGLFELT